MATSNSGSDQSDQIDQPTVPVDPQSSLPPEILAKMAYEHPELGSSLNQDAIQS